MPLFYCGRLIGFDLGSIIYLASNIEIPFGVTKRVDTLVHAQYWVYLSDSYCVHFSYVTQNHSVHYCLQTNTNGNTHFLQLGWIRSKTNIRPISGFSNFLVSGLAQYFTQFIGPLSVFSSRIRCYTVFTNLKYPSHFFELLEHRNNYMVVSRILI